MADVTSADLLLRIWDAAGGMVTLPAPRDLRMDSSVPGGYGSLAATIPWPAEAPPVSVINGAQRVQVVDCATGQVMWHGRLTGPGRTLSTRASGYAITAAGEQSILDGFRRAYSLVDRDLSHWTVTNMGSAQGQIVDGAGGLVEWPGDWSSPGPPGQVAEWAIVNGASVDSGSAIEVRYTPALYMGDGQITQVTGSMIGSNPFGGYWPVAIMTTVQFDDPFGGIVAGTGYPDVTQWNWVIRENHAPWGVGAPVRGVTVRVAYTGPSIDQVNNPGYVRIGNLIVYGRKYRRDGTEYDASQGPLYAWQVIEDLIGRGLGDLIAVDPYYAAPTAPVDQASWWAGVTAREVMSFVMSFAPSTWWAVWGPENPDGSGRPRMQVSTWGTDTRYVFREGPGVKVQLAGGADELANRGLVIYKRTESSLGTLEVSMPVPVLDDEGIVRSTTVDLTGRGPVTESRAKALGEAALVSLSSTQSSGTVTVSAPVMDAEEGRMVHPWEIRPGRLVQVGSMVDGPLPDPRVTSPDGVAVFRASAVSYDHGSRTATVTLDGGTRSLAQRIRVQNATRRYVASPATAAR